MLVLLGMMATAHAADDMAVTVCEAVTRATLPAGSTLTNASGKASGWAIVLTFEETHAGATAQPREAKCKYTRDGDQWKIVDEDPPEVTFCKVLEDGITERIRQHRSRPDDLPTLTRCRDAYKADLLIRAKRLQALFPLVQSGQYPISGDRTALR